MERKLKAERRDGAGKGVARKLRAGGRVPGVVYGHGEDPVSVSVDARELFHLLHTEAGLNVLVNMQIDGDRFLAMPKEVQRDHIRGRFVHVDFIRIARDEKVTVEVPINLVGESPGVKEGGVIEHHLWNLQVEAFPQDVPSGVEADISKLGMNESLKVGDLTLDGKLTLVSPEDEVIVAVVPPQILKVAEEELIEGEEALEAASEGEAATPTEAPPSEEEEPQE